MYKGFRFSFLFLFFYVGMTVMTTQLKSREGRHRYCSELTYCFLPFEFKSLNFWEVIFLVEAIQSLNQEQVENSIALTGGLKPEA